MTDAYWDDPWNPNMTYEEALRHWQDSAHGADATEREFALCFDLATFFAEYPFTREFLNSVWTTRRRLSPASREVFAQLAFDFWYGTMDELLAAVEDFS